MRDRDIQAELVIARTIAVSAYNAFRYALHNRGPGGQTLPAWDDLPEEAQDGWFRAVFVVKAETEDAQGIAWSSIAQKAYEVFAKAVGEGSRAWNALIPEQQVAWQAASRHILTLFEVESLSEVNIDELESSWSVWADKRNPHAVSGTL